MHFNFAWDLCHKGVCMIFMLKPYENCIPQINRLIPSKLNYGHCNVKMQITEYLWRIEIGILKFGFVDLQYTSSRKRKFPFGVVQQSKNLCTNCENTTNVLCCISLVWKFVILCFFFWGLCSLDHVPLVNVFRSWLIHQLLSVFNV